MGILLLSVVGAAAQLFVIILGITLIIRAASFYGSIEEFLKNILGILTLGYFVSTVIVMFVWFLVFGRC